VLKTYPALALVATGAGVVGTGVVVVGVEVARTTGVGVATGVGGLVTVMAMDVLALCPLASVAYTVIVWVPTSLGAGIHVNELDAMFEFVSVVPLKESTRV
jgi:hypothetical protein